MINLSSESLGVWPLTLISSYLLVNRDVSILDT